MLSISKASRHAGRLFETARLRQTKSSFARNCDPWATFMSLMVWVYLQSIFCDGLRNTCV